MRSTSSRATERRSDAAALQARPATYYQRYYRDTLGIPGWRELVAVEAAEGRVTRVLDGGTSRQLGGPLWPLVRAYCRLTGVRPHVELVATRREGS